MAANSRACQAPAGGQHRDPDLLATVVQVRRHDDHLGAGPRGHRAAPVGLMAADFPRLKEKVFERYPMMRSTASR